MKKETIMKWIGMAAMAAALMAATACAGILDKAANLVSEPRVVMVTNTVTAIQMVTNVVEKPVVQVVAGAPVTNLVREIQIVTNTVAVPVVQTNTVYVLKDAIATGEKVADAAAPFIPPPYNTAATAALGVVAAGLGWLVRRRNAEAAGLSDQNESLLGQLTATIKGVETVAAALPDGHGNKLKAAIAEVSKDLGVADDLHATVRTVTTA